MALTHSPLIVTDNLVFCVDAANTKSYSGSGTIWKDISGEGDDGTLINGPTFSNDNGGSIDFDGSNDKVDVNGDSSSFVLGSDNFSAETWVWFDSVSVGGIISKHASAIPHWFEYRIGATGKILTQVSLNGISWGISYQSTTSVTTNRWYNIMLVRDGSSFKTYINGIDGGGSGSSSSSISNNTSYPFRMGLRGGDDQGLNGRIAVVKIYKGKALSSTEVKQNYNTLKGRFL
tara:strand:- start:2640 stop:3335 length:696 start_codon:yes stop_codon:yes gene_type:complete